MSDGEGGDAVDCFCIFTQLLLVLRFKKKKGGGGKEKTGLTLKVTTIHKTNLKVHK